MPRAIVIVLVLREGCGVITNGLYELSYNALVNSRHSYGPLLLHRSLRSLPLPKGRGQKGGSGGEGSFAAGSPPRLHSENGFMAEAPLEGAVATWVLGQRELPPKRMMAQPLGFRVSGAFGTKAPIKYWIEVPPRVAPLYIAWGIANSSRVFSERCYYVTPRTARVYRHVMRVIKLHAPIRAWLD